MLRKRQLSMAIHQRLNRREDRCCQPFAVKAIKNSSSVCDNHSPSSVKAHSRGSLQAEKDSQAAGQGRKPTAIAKTPSSQRLDRKIASVVDQLRYSKMLQAISHSRCGASKAASKVPLQKQLGKTIAKQSRGRLMSGLTHCWNADGCEMAVASIETHGLE